MTVLVDTHLPWIPRTKGRPRRGRYGSMYTPDETVKAEKDIRDAWYDAFHDVEPIEGLIAVSLELENTRFRLRIEEADNYTNRKLRGDTDNYVKLISDALNEHAWVDDKQIVRITAAKL